MNNNGERDMKSLFHSCTTQIIPALKTESNGIMRMGYVVELGGVSKFRAKLGVRDSRDFP